MNRISTYMLLAALGALTATAQNMTDLSVSNTDIDNSQPAAVASTVDAAIFQRPERIRFDNKCFTIDGEDEFIMSGTFHYFRTPEALWADRLASLKGLGFNCVDIYVPWNWHETREPATPSDYSRLDLASLDRFLALATDMGLYVIVRPGPYICAEWAGGGFPQWLMHKRPATTKYAEWLQSNDPVFVEWNRHWYDAVCAVVRPYQVTERAVGDKGVIMMQIENEFNRIKWFTAEDKEAYLAHLADIVRADGIEVPLVSCWTSQCRNSAHPSLRGVVDMVNSYPRWNIERSFGRLINQQLATQPGKPLLSGELQGGWYSDINTPLSWEQDGVSPAQTINLTLYALQRGFSSINYYMAVGGTNLDDWGARDITATYDFAAAISEDGSLNERARAFSSLADFISNHATAIARAEVAAEMAAVSDSLVSAVVRVTDGGDRYVFVRTEDRSREHCGAVDLGDCSIGYHLMPFGSAVCHIPAGAREGEWWPKAMPSQLQPKAQAQRIAPALVAEFDDPMPARWQRLGHGESVDRKGVMGRHPIYYRAKAPAGSLLTLRRPGKGAVNGTQADTILVLAAGEPVPIEAETDTAASYRLPAGKGSLDIVMLYESKGLHHHTNLAVERWWANGLTRAEADGKPLRLEYAYAEADRGVALSAGEELKSQGANPLLKWFIYDFELPPCADGVITPYFLKMNQAGNGYIYVNGHCIGRCWQGGPQTAYYMPECWLNAGGKNRVAISLRPTDLGAAVADIAIEPGSPHKSSMNNK